MALPQYTTEKPEVTVPSGAQAIIDHLLAMPSMTQRRVFVTSIEADQRIQDNENERQAQAIFDGISERIGERADPSIFDLLMQMVATYEETAEHLTSFLTVAENFIAIAVRENQGRGLTEDFMGRALRAPLISHRRKRDVAVRHYHQIVKWARQASGHPRGLLWSKPQQTVGQLADELINRAGAPSVDALNWATERLRARTAR